MDLHNRVALITGASRGIGAAIARTLSARGMQLALVSRKQDALDRIAGELGETASAPLLLPADLSQTSQVEQLVQHTLDRFGRLDCLVNNAGIGVYGNVESFATTDYDHIMAVNARAPFILCRDAIPHLREQEQGWMINIASVVAVKGYPQQAAYAASKHALLGLSKSLRREVKDDNIRVHTLCFGGVDTELVTSARPDLDRSVLMQPAEIAEVVHFLLTRDGNAVIDNIDLRRTAAEPWD